MSKIKIIAFTVILFGIGVSLLVTNSDSKPFGDFLTVSKFKENTNPSLQFKSTPQSQANIFGVYGGLGGGSENQGTDNLTELVAQAYAKELLKNVERGSGRVEERNLNIATPDLQQVLQEKIVQDFDFPKFNLKDIRISGDNSSENQITYMEAIDSLLRENFSGFKKDINIALEEFFKENNPQTIHYLTSHISDYINGLLELETPPQWQEYHLQYTNLWYKKLLMYQAVLNIQTDPLKTYVVIQTLPEIIQEDLDLQSILIQRYEELTS
ncbi:MAG: hypothetical protein KJI72_02220 [Patescibacteria group bacterium]|nr:hypothetical protein [Patescibacteria group bacterium]